MDGAIPDAAGGDEGHAITATAQTDAAEHMASAASFLSGRRIAATSFRGWAAGLCGAADGETDGEGRRRSATGRRDVNASGVPGDLRAGSASRRVRQRRGVSLGESASVGACRLGSPPASGRVAWGARQRRDVSLGGPSASGAYRLGSPSASGAFPAASLPGYDACGVRAFVVSGGAERVGVPGTRGVGGSAGAPDDEKT